MTDWYVDSNAAGTNAGTSWTNACTKFATLLGTAFAAGDRCFARNTHNETTASGVTLTWPGTAAAPNIIISTTNAHTPPVAADITAGAKMSTTGASSITWTGVFYVYGVTLNCGTGSSAANIAGANNTRFHTWDNCKYILGTTASGSQINFIGNTNAQGILINPTFTFGAVGQAIGTSGRLKIYNSSVILTGGSIPTSLFRAQSAGGGCLVSGCDLSAITSGNNLVDSSGATMAAILFQNCRLASGVTVCSTPAFPSGVQVDLVNCDSGATGYRQERYWYAGTLTTSTTVYNHATDGVTPISWQAVSTGNCFRYAPFECFEIVVKDVPVGTYASATIAITSATASLTNADVWAEVQYLGNASYPLASGITSAPATQLTAGSPLTGGSWGTGSAGNDYVLSIPSFTTAIQGDVHIVVKVGKASLTAYVDPSPSGIIASRRGSMSSSGYQGVYVVESAAIQYRNKMAGNLG